IGAMYLIECHSYCFLNGCFTILFDFFDQMNKHLGIRFCLENMPSFGQLFFNDIIIFNDTIMYQNDITISTVVRMSIYIIGQTMRGPSCMTNTNTALYGQVPYKIN